MNLILAAGMVLVAGAGVVLALGRRPSHTLAAILSQLVATILVLVAVIPVLAGGGELQADWSWSFPVDVVTVRVDALSAFFLSWSLPLTLLGTIYGTGYLNPYLTKGRNGAPHFALLNLVSLSFIIIYSSRNALVYLLGWEIAAVCAWLLVIWDYRSQKVRFAGFNYLVSTHLGLLTLVAAFMLVHSQVDSLELDDFARFLEKPSELRSIAFVLFGIAFAFKSAFFPVHTWLPRAHAAAPAHVSALMSGVIHKAGLFGFLRVTLLIGRPEEWMGWCVIGFGLLSAVFAVLYTATQRDMKRLLGYSSTENVGIVAIGFGVGYLGLAWGDPTLVAVGFAGGLFHIANHALFKCLLFYGAGAIFRTVHTVDLERLGGLAKSMPRTAALFLAGGLAMSAIPPLNGFASELLVYSGLYSGVGHSLTADLAFVVSGALLAFVGAVGALAMTRAFGAAFLGSAREPHRVASDPPPTMLTPMAAHAFLIALLGLVPELGLALVRAAAGMFGSGGGEAANAVLNGAAWASRGLAIALVIMAALGWWLGRGARLHRTWGCGYTAPSPRMQYTASSFAAPFVQLFAATLVRLTRQKLPRKVFPSEPGHLATHHVDAVEARLFEAIGRGDDLVTTATSRIPEAPRLAFLAGLVLLIGLVALVMWEPR